MNFHQLQYRQIQVTPDIPVLSICNWFCELILAKLCELLSYLSLCFSLSLSHSFSLSLSLSLFLSLPLSNFYIPHFSIPFALLPPQLASFWVLPEPKPLDIRPAGGLLRTPSVFSILSKNGGCFWHTLSYIFSAHITKMSNPGHARSGHQVTSSDLTS